MEEYILPQIPRGNHHDIHSTVTAEIKSDYARINEEYIFQMSGPSLRKDVSIALAFKIILHDIEIFRLQSKSLTMTYKNQKCILI